MSTWQDVKAYDLEVGNIIQYANLTDRIRSIEKKGGKLRLTVDNGNSVDVHPETVIETYR